MEELLRKIVFRCFDSKTNAYDFNKVSVDTLIDYIEACDRWQCDLVPEILLYLVNEFDVDITEVETVDELFEKIRYAYMDELLQVDMVELL